MGNLVYGQLDDENNVQIDHDGNPLQVTDVNGNIISESSESFSTLESRPYIETGIGLENILNFIRLDAVWRITYTNDQYLSVYPRAIHPFGLKASFQFTF